MTCFNKGFFKPCVLIVSIPVLPYIVCLIYLTVTDFGMGHVIGTLLLISGYALSVLAVYKISVSNRECLMIHDGYIEIKGATGLGNGNLTIDFESIKKIEYYKITSFRGWMIIFTSFGNLPQSVFVTYLKDGKEVCRCIGYPTYDDTNVICNKIGIELTIV